MNITERANLVATVVAATRFFEELEPLESGSDHAVWHRAFDTKEEADQEIEVLSEVAHYAEIEGLDFASMPGDEDDSAEAGRWLISVIAKADPEPA